MSSTRRRRSAAVEGQPTRPRGTARAWRRVGRGALVVAAGTAALALAGPLALRPFVDAAHAAGTAGEVSVAFVLDFGGSAKGQVVGCVTVPSSDNRYYALSAFLQQEALTQPTYATSGLLCSINGVPSSGCGQPSGGHYIYWAYYTGSGGSWTYSSTGAGNQVGTDDVEGWRFQDPGSGNPGDPPPRTAPNYAAICGTSTPSTTPAGGGPGGGSGGAHPGGASGGHARAHGHRSTAAAATGAATAGAATSKSSSTSTSSTTTSTYPPDTSTTVPPISIPADPEVGLATARHAASGGSGPGPDPLIIGGLLVAALAVAGYTRWRKRPRTR